MHEEPYRKVFELLGAEASGKSSLVERAKSKRSPDEKEFLTLHEAFQEVKKSKGSNFPEQQGSTSAKLDIVLSSEEFLAAEMAKYVAAIRKKYQAIQCLRNNVTGPILIDEGLAQRGLNLADAKLSSIDQIVAYYESIPVPEVLLLIELDPFVCMARNQERGKVDPRTNRYRGVFRSLYIMKVGAGILEGRGSHIVRFDGSLPIDENVGAFYKLLDRYKI